MKISSVSKLSYLLLALTILLACKKENLPNISCNEKSNAIDLVRKLLPGSYYWTYTEVTYQIGSHIATPATTGTNHKYVYSKNGERSYYVNNVLKSIDTYTIDYLFKLTAYPSDSATIVIINDSQTGQRKTVLTPYLCTDSAYFHHLSITDPSIGSSYKRN